MLLLVASIGCPIQVLAQMNISGKPGLIYVPSAEIMDDGTFSIGYNYNPINYAFKYNKTNSESIAYVNLALLPRLEVNLNLLNANGDIAFKRKGIGDRQVDVKYAILTERAKRPAVAVILSAPFGVDNSLLTHAIVATKHTPVTRSINAAVTVGYGSPYTVGRRTNQNDILSDFRFLDKKRDLQYNYLVGPFGGVSLNFARKGGVMAEWDSQHLNVGAYTTLFNHWTIQAGLLNGEQLTVGTSYKVNLLRSQKQVRTSKPTYSATKTRSDGEVLGSNSERNVLLDYENLAVDSTNRRVYYEQRLYRNPFTGIVKLADPLAGQQINEFVPLFQGVPIARYRVGETLTAGTLSKQERADYAVAHPFDSRNYKLDFRIQPEFIAQFGFREQTVESKTNLLLQSQLFLSRGLVLNWGVLVPLINKLDNQPLNVRPAPTFLNQFLALDGRNFLSLSAGLFYNDQYGVNAQYRHADVNSNWSYGVESGLTGFYYFPESGFYYESLNHLLLLADVAYRIPKRDITVKVSGGQFLRQDRGARVDVIRQLGNVEIGFFAVKTGNGTTGGFNFAIPIPPGRIAQSQRLRLRTSEEFRWEYAYTRGYNIAGRYKVGYQLDALLRQYQGSYLQNQYR
ncbi:YjbH domain-containing protein [Fibrella sp. HMF5405]|uniref:YjbH domain-containing protein n=2 Tax=Fibrella forsythiae TaxID=2817061 RepID=A0ABS3JET2_9BACT|nr:YjbH domain-containing protein [Fibrella forsythiae]